MLMKILEREPSEKKKFYYRYNYYCIDEEATRSRDNTLRRDRTPFTYSDSWA